MRVLICFLLVLCNVIFFSSTENNAEEIISPNLYVAPNGDDSNPGTEMKPFATLEQARNAVREFKKSVPKPITIFVRGGTYYLSEPLVFGPEDTGTDMQPITYTAYPGEKPTISGGVKLDARWEPYKDGIMKSPVPAGIDFDQLFINGKRQMRARFPNFNPQKPLMNESGYINATGGGNTEGSDPFISYDPETFTKNRWSKPTEAIVHIFPTHYWHNLQFRIKSIVYGRHLIEFGEGGWHANQIVDRNEFSEGSRFFIDNVFEELDAPGEWYLDKEKCILYYLPLEGLDLAGA